MNDNQLISINRRLSLLQSQPSWNPPAGVITYNLLDPMHYVFTYDFGDDVKIHMEESENASGRNDFVNADFEDSVPESFKAYYAIAAASGALTGALSFVKLSEEQLSKVSEWKEKSWKPIIIYAAELAGCKKKDYKAASKYLVDQAVKRAKKDSTAKEYMTLLTAHPTLAGLLFSLITQYAGELCYVSENGEITLRKIPKYYYIGNTSAEKIVAAVMYWMFELAAAQAVSKRNLIANLGIPVELLKKIKSFTCIPFLQKIPENHNQAEEAFSAWLCSTINEVEFDMFKESQEQADLAVRFMKIALNLGEDAFPVLINEGVVRSLYLVIRLCAVVKEHKIASFEQLNEIPASEMFPEDDRLLSGMCLVASASFMAVNISVAALKAIGAVKAGHRDFLPVFLAELNIPAVGRLVFACARDSKFWGEDIKLLFQRAPHTHSKTENTEEFDDDAFTTLTLTPAQARILYCLENISVRADIRHTENPEQVEAKRLWLQNWRHNIVLGANLPLDQENLFFVEDEDCLYDGIYRLSKDKSNYAWFYLLTQELALFKPYCALGCEDDEKFQKLRTKYDYVSEQFVRRQTIITQAELDAIKDTYKKYFNILSGKVTRTITSIAGGVAVTALTGGLAFTFAPGIAVMIAGEAVVGLHGAALTSASLAFVGGGSLAAGGLGMAGGTAIITGGGALIGIAGSGGASAVAALMAAPIEYWTRQSAKLLTHSKCTLCDTLQQKNLVKSLLCQIEKAEDLAAEELASLKEEDTDLDKEYIKRLDAYLDCLKKVHSELQKLIK